MILEAACGAEREVKVVEGSEALEGCPTSPAASEQEKKNGWTGTQKFPIQVLPGPPPVISVFIPKRHRTSQIPSIALLCKHSFYLPRCYGLHITPAPSTYRALTIAESGI